MSIPASTVLRHIRLQINDFDEAKVSNFQILIFLNRALSAVSSAIAMRGLDFLTASHVYSSPSEITGAALPDDYQSVREVTDGSGYTLTPTYITKTPQTYEYKIMGEKIYCGASSYTLFYQRFIGPVDDLETDNIAVPAYCLGLIVQTTVNLMQGMAAPELVQAINNIIDTDIPILTYDKKRGRVIENAG